MGYATARVPGRVGGMPAGRVRIRTTLGVGSDVQYIAGNVTSGGGGVIHADRASTPSDGKVSFAPNAGPSCADLICAKGNGLWEPSCSRLLVKVP